MIQMPADVVAADSKVTDEALRAIRALPDLRHLALCGANVTDQGLDHLLVHKNLETLDLFGTNISDARVGLLARLKHLTFLDISETQWELRKKGAGSAGVTSRSGMALQKQLPNCRVRY